MSSYFVAQITIDNPLEYQRYLDRFDAVLERYDGTVLAVDDEVRALEGHWPHKRAVIISFPSHDELTRWYESDEYQQIARLRQAASRATVIAVKGREGSAE